MKCLNCAAPRTKLECKYCGDKLDIPQYYVREAATTVVTPYVPSFREWLEGVIMQ